MLFRSMGTLTVVDEINLLEEQADSIKDRLRTLRARMRKEFGQMD